MNFWANLMIYLSVIAIASCSAKKQITLYTADCNGKLLTFTVQEKEHRAHAAYWMEINIGHTEGIRITPKNVIESRPYHFSLLHTHPHYWYDTSRQTFLPDLIVKRRMVLFIDPQIYTRQDFEEINTCLAHHYRKMEQLLYQNYIKPEHSFNYPQFAGIVYGNLKDFLEVYEGEKESLLVRFNGEITRANPKGVPIAQEVFGIKLQSAKQESVDGEAIFPPDTEWMKYKNARTNRLFGEDYAFCLARDGTVYGLKK